MCNYTLSFWTKLTNSRGLVTRCITTFLYCSSSPWGIKSSLQTHNNLISLCVYRLSVCHLSWKPTISLTHPVAQLLVFIWILKGGFWHPSALWTTMMTKCIIQWCLPQYYYIKGIQKGWRYFCGYPIYVA